MEWREHEMKNIYAIVGDVYHDEDLIQQSLNLALKPLTDGGRYQLEYISVEQLTDGLQNKPAAVILFKEDRVNPKDEVVRHWLTKDISEAISRNVQEGGGFLAWHSGMASYPPDSAFVRMLRGYFDYHPSKHQTVSYKGSLPTEAGKEISFDVMDEHYFVICDEANTNVFLQSDSVDGHSLAGWSHTFGEGRVCCLTPAHNKEGLLNATMIELLRSSVQFVAGE
jgi:type 1 glutamine amidotransferase